MAWTGVVASTSIVIPTTIVIVATITGVTSITVHNFSLVYLVEFEYYMNSSSIPYIICNILNICESQQNVVIVLSNNAKYVTLLRL